MKQVIELNPNEKHLQEINEWLRQELALFENGFYHNWNIINKAFEEERMLVSLVDEKPVAFLIFSERDMWCEIDILNVKEDFKGKGIGTNLFKSLEKHLRKMKYFALKLFCEPRDSELFWKKMGFIKAPTRGAAEHDLTYWKPLKEVLVTEVTKNLPKDRIEIWNSDCVDQDEDPTWVYDLNGEIDIIAYCHYDWKCKVFKDGLEIENCKLKYLNRTYDKFIFSPFFIVRQEQINEILESQKG